MNSYPGLVNRIRAEYQEMPGLTLNAAQLQRLCGIDAAVCREALAVLIETGFLSIRPDGSYGRTIDASRARPATAGLAPTSHSTVSRLGRRAS